MPPLSQNPAPVPVRRVSAGWSRRTLLWGLAWFLLVQAGILVRPLFNDAVNTGLPHFTQHALLMATSFLVCLLLMSRGRIRAVSLGVCAIGLMAVLRACAWTWLPASIMPAAMPLL